ncbi:unnamed protein product [Tetraodon nigroviridis]|uniref:(spotted green pufferfish) hypothetical protein n=1 Tax=Tetraodon nigroviridis TaxID=99883 RepID=Q4SJS8_TETNG|nr:unnamed protein product [Tetraodon nigroviridis]
MVGKSRHAGTSSLQSVGGSTAPGLPSDGEGDPEKENQDHCNHQYRNNSLVESSDDDFDQFLQRVKTPNTKPKKMSDNGSEDSLKNFIVDDFSSDDDFTEKKPTFKVPTKVSTQTPQQPHRRPPSPCDLVFVSDDEEDDVVLKSTWRTRHSKPPPKAKVKDVLCDEAESSATGLLSSPFSPPGQTTSLTTPKHTFPAPLTKDDSPSSEEEFTSLLERLKKKNKFPSTTPSPLNTQGSCLPWSFPF